MDLAGYRAAVDRLQPRYAARGVRILTGRDPQQVYADYFDELRRMVLAVPGHVVSHFDRILFRGTPRGAPLDVGRCERPICLALESVATPALALELNTRLLDRDRRWRAGVGTMLGWYREAGGTRIVVNSDAHDSDQISQNFDLARDLLPEAVYPALESDFLAVGAPPLRFHLPARFHLRPR